jgi:hypothetical protein
VQLKGLGKLTKSTSMALDPTTSRLVSYYLNQLHYRVPWSLILEEEYRSKVFENRMQRRIFGPKRVEVKREWGKLPNEKLHNLYFSSNIIITGVTELHT